MENVKVFVVTKRTENDLEIATPLGLARFPCIGEPDTRFKSCGIYSVGVIVSRMEAVSFHKTCLAVFEKAFPGEKPRIIPVRHGRGDELYILAESVKPPSVIASVRQFHVKVAHLDRIKAHGTLRPFRRPGAQGLGFMLREVEIEAAARRAA